MSVKNNEHYLPLSVCACNCLITHFYFHTLILNIYLFGLSFVYHLVRRNPPYPCRMGCRCRMTWALWSLPLGSPSSSFTVSRCLGDTVTSAPAIAPPTQSCTHRGPRMHVNSQSAGTHMQRPWLMHTLVNGEKKKKKKHPTPDLTCLCVLHWTIQATGPKQHNPL